MKKVTSILVIALISIISVLNVNAMGSKATKENLIINGKQIASGQQFFIYFGSKDNSIYFDARNRTSAGEFITKYYKYNNGNLTEIKENEIDESDLSNQKNWTISKHYKLEKFEDDTKTNVYVDGKLDGTFYTNFDRFFEISNNAFYYNYIKSNGELDYKVFIFENKDNTSIENKKTTTNENEKLDKTLNKVFEKVDEKGEETSKKIYKTLIEKIDILLKNKLSEKNKNTLNYIKEKVEEKIK